jgi:hypothetical protein
VNVFNRVLLVVILAVIAALAISVIFFAWVAPVSSTDALDESVDWLQENQGDLEKLLVSTGAALVALLAGTLLVLELVPRHGSEVAITDLRVGNATLSTDAISQRVEEAVAQIRHVSEVRASVAAKRKGVSVDLDLHVDPEANLATVTDEACEAARDVLQNRVHVALTEPPTARLHYREIRASRAAAAARRPMLTAPSTRAAVPASTPYVPPPQVEERHDVSPAPRRDLPANRTDLLENGAVRRLPPEGTVQDEHVIVTPAPASQPAVDDEPTHPEHSSNIEASSRDIPDEHDQDVESPANAGASEDQAAPEERRRLQPDNEYEEPSEREPRRRL